MSSNYEQYAITGFKIQWNPINCVGTKQTSQEAANGAIMYLWTYEDVDTYNTAGYSAE